MYLNIIKEILERSKSPKLLKENISLSRNLKFHIQEGIPLNQNIFRKGSEAYFDLFVEARKLYKEKSISLSKYDKDLIESDIGEFFIEEGEKIYLDFPYQISNEEYYSESYFSLINEKRSKKRKKSKRKSSKNKKKPLNKPMRDSSGSSKFKVYVKDPETGNIKTVRFGAKGMSTGLNNPKRVKSFVARHRCKTHAKDKTKAAYWSCRLPRYFGNSGKLWW